MNLGADLSRPIRQFLSLASGLTTRPPESAPPGLDYSAVRAARSVTGEPLLRLVPSARRHVDSASHHEDGRREFALRLEERRQQVSRKARAKLARLGMQLCIALALLHATPSVGQEPPASPVPAAQLDVELLVAAALGTHPSIAVKRLDQAGAASGVDVARLQFFPTPSVQVDAHEGKQATVFRLTQPLWTGGRLTADLNAAELKQARAAAALAEAQVGLAGRVVSLYHSYLLQTGREASQERGVEKLDQLVKMIERRVTSGVSAQIDLDLARSRHSQATSDLIALHNSVRAVLSQLSQATGRSLGPSSLVASPPDALSIAPATSPMRQSMTAVLDRALASSPTLSLAAIDARLARNEIDQTRSALWPTIALRAEQQSGSYPGSAASGGRIFLTLQYTPGAGASVIPQAAAAETRAQASEQMVQAARRDLQDRVESEWLDFQSASARLPQLERTRAGSAEVLDSSARLFVTGRRTWLDLLNAVRELMQIEQLGVEARATAFGSGYRLRLLAGESFWPEDGVLP